jgi:O-antigen/teichoic acid export membrane protein
LNVKTGFLWMLLNESLGKGASLIAQVFLGYLLSKEDFGVFALATSVSLVAAGLGNGGIQPILIQRGAEYGSIAPAALKFAFLFNALACGLLLLAGPMAARLYGKPDLEWLVWCIGCSLPLLAPLAVFRAKLAIDGRIGAIANLGVATSWIRQGGTVALAFLGFGALSFGLPILLEAAVGSLAGWRLAGRWPAGAALSRRRFAELFAAARWVMPGSFVVHFTQRGDYFVIGLFVEAATLGVYFFGLQLVNAVSVMFISSLEVVMLPALSRQGSREQARLFLRSLSAACLLSMPIAFAIAVFSEPLIQLVWRGHWDEAIPITRWLAASFPGVLLISLSRSLLEAQARWRARFWLLALFGGLGAAVACASAARGDIAAVAAAVAIYRVGFGLLQLMVAARCLPVGRWMPLKQVLRPLIFLGTAAGFAVLLRNRWLDGWTSLPTSLATFALFLAAALALGFTLFRAYARDALGLLVARFPARGRELAASPAARARP